MPTFSHDQAELFYEERGRGEPLLLLHGLGSSTLDWAPQLEAFAPHYRVIAVDARGSGRSRDLRNAAGPFSVKQFAADDAALLRHLGATPAHVVGLSMGGMIAFQLAVDFPDLVRTLTIVNSGPALVPKTTDERFAIGVRRLLTSLLGPAGMGKILAPKLFPKPADEALRQQFMERMAGNDKAAYKAGLNAIIGWSVLDRISAIEAPTLIVHAEHDYTALPVKEAYAARMKHARVVTVADARHALPMEEPEKFNRVILQFLADPGSGGV
ncbi:MAG: alpha/beta hydrolase [Acidobacteriota bacterium]